MNFDFGLRGHDIADNFSDMCKLARENDIKKLQFAMAKTISDVNFDELGFDEEFAKKVDAGLKADNLDVSVLGCYINPVDTDSKAKEAQLLRFKNFLRYAKVFNAGGVGTETGSLGDIKSTRSDENYKRFLNDFEPVITLAEELDVNVYIEPVWHFTINSVDKMKRMIDDVKSKKLKVILDVSNITVVEDFVDPSETIEKAFDALGDDIRVIHYKDFIIADGKKSFAIAGTGDLDAKLIFKKISECSIAPDVILDETPLEHYRQSVENLRNIVL